MTPEWCDDETWACAEEKAAGYVAYAIEWSPDGKPLPELVSTAIAVDLSRYLTLEAALRIIQSAIPGYLKGEMTEKEFALVCVGAVDNAKVNKALEGKK